MSMPLSVLPRTSAAPNECTREFASDVRSDLSKPQKELHSKYLYDELGSALFEAITHLPEYGVTRADERLLRKHARDIAELIPETATVIELGSGTGRKTRYVLNALKRADRVPRYFPIDVSREALGRCLRELADIADVRPLEYAYLDGMARAAAHRRAHESLLVLFLGSTIGNFERERAIEFLRDLREWLLPGDALLIGADLVKERDRMLLAYDDPTGVTAAFNLNVLGRMNRELGADFDLRKFEHQTRWDETERRIEMHLRSRVDQSVFIPEADFRVRFRGGETIWTESSHKFQRHEMFEMAAQTGFRVKEQWVDLEWPFVESLWMVP
jgi:L-histidine N-alpha-methyltransferase